MTRTLTTTLAGWGNYLPVTCHVYRPERLSELRQAVAAPQAVGDRHDLIARGLGRSYGDSATNSGGGVILQQRLDCFRAFDADTGEVDAEAGVSLAAIIDLVLPRGWFLPVTPGTKFVTLGGAIAADVHGKNHHVDGALGNFVRSLRLLLADGSVVTCSADENADLFHATVGGMGLTGVILSATLRLHRVASAYIAQKQKRAANLADTLAHFAKPDSPKYSVAWIDCLAAGESLGRSVIMEGDHATIDQLPQHLRGEPLALPRRRKRGVPVNFPGFALNRLSVKLFNKLYYARHGDREQIVDLDTFFYPLDAVHQWNRIYGRRGFVQYQALLPHDTAAVGVRELLERISASGQASFLAVLKRTGAQGPGLLSFPMPGYTIALDLPNRGETMLNLLAELDRIVLANGGRLYLAKDATMSSHTFAAMYPRLGEFRAVKARVDPTNRFNSTQARRVGIT